MTDKGTTYEGISASGEARQHNGNNYDYHDANVTYGNAYHYYPSQNFTPLQQQRADDSLTPQQRNREFIRAASGGQWARMLHLLDTGASVEYKNEHGLAAAHYAAWDGKSDVLQKLLQRFADADPRNDHVGTPLCLAAFRGQSQTVKLLLEHKASPFGYGGCFGSPLHAACYCPNSEICKDILAAGDATAILTRSRAVDLTLREQVFSSYMKSASLDDIFENIDENGLHASAEDMKAFATSGQWGLPPTKKLLTVPVTLASENGHSDVLRVLLKCEHAYEGTAKINSDGRNALHEAASKGDFDIVRALVEAGAYIDMLCTAGNVDQTALLYACENGHVPVARYLLEHGADYSCRDARGGGAAWKAASRKGTVPLLEALVEHGVPLDTRDNFGQTPLHVAVGGGRDVDVVRYLVSKGLNHTQRTDINGHPLTSQNSRHR